MPQDPLGSKPRSVDPLSKPLQALPAMLVRYLVKHELAIHVDPFFQAERKRAIGAVGEQAASVRSLAHFLAWREFFQYVLFFRQCVSLTPKLLLAALHTVSRACQGLVVEPLAFAHSDI